MLITLLVMTLVVENMIFFYRLRRLEKDIEVLKTLFDIMSKDKTSSK